jgi:hypothetical protein
MLGLDRETVDAREAEALTPVIQTLASGRATAAAEALRQLRDAVRASEATADRASSGQLRNLSSLGALGRCAAAAAG